MTARNSTDTSSITGQEERSDEGLTSPRTRPRPSAHRIVVAGGYGQVGTKIARLLAPSYPGRVVLAGRDRRRAAQVAAAMGNGVRGQLLDTANRDLVDEAVAGAALVVCAAPAPARFAATCLSAGAGYLDVTADTDLLEQMQRLHPLAISSGASAVLSVGLAPGLSTIMAAHAAAGLDTLDRLDVLVLLGLGDVHGPAALHWMLDGLGSALPGDGAGRSVPAFTERRRFLLPRPQGQPDQAITGYRFDFPDQTILPRITGAARANTWLALQPAPVAPLLAAAGRAGLTRHLNRPAVRRTVIRLLRRVRLGSDRAAVLVTATGSTGGRRRVARAAADGRDESLLTALVAAHTAEQMLGRATPPGVWHLPQFVADPARLCSWLSSQTDITITLDPTPAHLPRPSPPPGPTGPDSTSDRSERAAHPGQSALTVCGRPR